MRRTLCVGVGLLWLTGCLSEMRTGGSIGGANQNGRSAGNVKGGVRLKQGEIAVAPSGRYFVTVRNSVLQLGTIPGDSIRAVSEYRSPELLSFWQRDGAEGFVLLHDGTLTSYNTSSSSAEWSQSAPAGARRLDISSDGTRVVASGPEVRIVDVKDGRTVYSSSAQGAVRDVDLLQGGRKVLITEETSWQNATGPTTRMSVRNTDDGTQTCEVTADNCSSEVEVSGDENRAFLAPTMCQKDPVTVVDVNNCQTEKQMAGFGPVAMSPDRKTLVAFLDRDSNDPAAPALPAEVKRSNKRYHLMFIDAQSLEFTTAPVGNHLPRYTFVPDGSALLVDTPIDLFSTIQVMDLSTKRLQAVQGPPIKLNAYTLSSDGRRAFVLENGLFELDIARRVLEPMQTRRPPQSINMTPDGLTLLVTEKSDALVMFLDAISGRESGAARF